MSVLMPHIAARVFNTPLIVDDSKIAAMLAGMGGRIVGASVLIEDVEPQHHVAFEGGRLQMGALTNRVGRAAAAQGRPLFDVIDGVAVIPIEGTLVHKGAYVGQSSGETSYQGLQAQIAAAMDPSIKGAVFEVDSNGGEVSGGFQTAAMIAQLSKLKPTMSILTDHANSGGYLLASGARQVVMPSQGSVGSIGCLAVLADLTGAAEQQGIRATVVRSGAAKADTHPLAPLPGAVDRVQAAVDGVRDEFAATVGKSRTGRIDKKGALATEANVYGAADAMRLGLVDAVANPNDAFAAFIKAVNKQAA